MRSSFKLFFTILSLLVVLGITTLRAEEASISQDTTKKEEVDSAQFLAKDEKNDIGQPGVKEGEINSGQVVLKEGEAGISQDTPKKKGIFSSLIVVKEDESNNGQDFTRPVCRVEMLDRYDDMAGNAWSNSFILRVGLPFELKKGWRLSLRAELPYTWTNGISANNPQGESIQGFSEVLTEALFIAPAKDKWTYVVGAQYIPPSASKDELGTGRYQLVPSVGFKYDMNGWMKGAWVGMMARQAVDVAGYSGYSPINQTIIQPMFNIDLPDQWFLTFAPECRYDWKKDKGFIPFDVIAGKKITNKIVMSFEYKSAINDDLLLFVNEFDVRVGFFF